MSNQFYEAVFVNTYSYIDDKSVDEIFRLGFSGARRSKRNFSTNKNKLTNFYVTAKLIEPKQVKEFEKRLESDGYVKLYSTIYTEPIGEGYAYFFTIKLNLEHFSDMRDLFLAKLDSALGKKVKAHEDIYYFHLSNTQSKSKTLLQLLDKLMNNPIVNTIIVV